MEHLNHDLLVVIANLLPASDLRSFYKVCKAFRAAVRDASVAICLRRHLDIGELLQISSHFRNAVALKINGVHVFKSQGNYFNDSHGELGELFENFRELKNVKLETFIGLVTLPDAFFRLSSLNFLSLQECLSMEALPAAISSLTSLQTLVLDQTYLVMLPESLGALPCL